MEGVQRYQVRLLPHQAAWDEEFLACRTMLEEIWGENVLEIQHVGSTAIPSICAKPVLDVAIRLKSIASMDIAALTERGYSYAGPQFGNEEYHLFVLRGENETSLHHIHCYGPTEKEFDQLTGFRDYLNSHPSEAKEYEAIKLRLAESYASDRSSYTKGKAAFIQSVYDKLGLR